MEDTIEIVTEHCQTCEKNVEHEIYESLNFGDIVYVCTGCGAETRERPHGADAYLREADRNW